MPFDPRRIDPKTDPNHSERSDNIYGNCGPVFAEQFMRKTRELKTFERRTARGHLMAPQQHVCNGLAHPANDSVLAGTGQQRDMVKTCLRCALRIARGGIN